MLFGSYVQKFCNGDFDDCYPLNLRVNVTGRTRGGPQRALLRLLTLEIDHRHWYEVLPSCFSPMWFLAALAKIKCAAGPFQSWEGASELNSTILFVVTKPEFVEFRLLPSLPRNRLFHCTDVRQREMPKRSTALRVQG